MNFRTEIEIPSRQVLDIRHGQGIMMLGSCFTDNVGERLQRDGFDVEHNPMGPLYNPASIYNAISLALKESSRENLTLRSDEQGKVHCLDFASRYAADTAHELKAKVIDELDHLKERLLHARTIILTLGTAYVFAIEQKIVGNCHKFNSNLFSRERLTVAEAIKWLQSTIDLLPKEADIIFTVSPIRHTADNLHGNQLSKATLQLAVDNVVDKQRVHYFPSYEIMLDDLRDYRFYAADMKHPSEVAVDYIYDVFTKYYFSKDTLERCIAARKQSLRQAHRPILS